MTLPSLRALGEGFSTGLIMFVCTMTGMWFIPIKVLLKFGSFVGRRYI